MASISIDSTQKSTKKKTLNIASNGYPVVTIEDDFTIEAKPNNFYDIKNETGDNINLLFNNELEFNDKLNSYLFKINSPCNIYINKEFFWDNKEIPDFTKNCIYYIQIDNDIASYKTITANIDIPNNQLWYKTCNNEIADFTNPEFQQNIISHVYEDNKGIITFDSDLTIIPDGLFFENPYISYIEIPQSVISIGETSLGMCRLVIKNIINHSNVNTNDNNYFGASIYDKEENNLLITNNIVKDIRPDITTIILPKYVIGLDIKNWYFTIDNVTSISVLKDNPILIDDNCNAIINKNEKSLLLGCKNTIIPNYIEIIKEYAFVNANLQTISIPESVKSIGKSAFRNTKLISIVLSEAIKDIEEHTFDNCTNLTNINLDNINIIDNSAFYNCINLTNVNLSENLSYLGDYAFSNCINLTNVNLSNKITYIGEKCFYQCNLKSVIIPENVTILEYQSFAKNTYLSEITIPKSVVQIKTNAFGYCDNVTNVTYKGTIAEWNNISRVGSIYGKKVTIHCTDGDTTGNLY